MGNNIIIGDFFSENNISQLFFANTINGNYFYKNIIAFNFNNNIGILDNFTQNNICDRVQLFDFSLATFVYGDFTKNIFRGNAGTLYLELFNQAGLPPSWSYITPINS